MREPYTARTLNIGIQDSIANAIERIESQESDNNAIIVKVCKWLIDTHVNVYSCTVARSVFVPHLIISKLFSLGC